MNKSNSNETISKADLSEQRKFWLDEISKIEKYFIEEMNHIKSCSQKLNKYVTTYDYKDKTLIVLRATTGGVSIISFTSVIGAPVGKILNITRKKKRHDKILDKCWLKVNLIALKH